LDSHFLLLDINILLFLLLLFTVGQNSPFRHSDSLKAGQSGGKNPGGGEIFRTCPDRPWDPGYRVFPGSKPAGAWRRSPPPSSAEVKKRVQRYPYSPSGTLERLLSWNSFLSFTLPWFLPLRLLLL